MLRRFTGNENTNCNSLAMCSDSPQLKTYRRFFPTPGSWLVFIVTQ